MPDLCQISFPGTDYPPITVQPLQNLSDYLTIQNSPVLFGCRTGICGTCLVAVMGDVPPPEADEQEMLETFAPHHPHARLACQIDITANLEIRELKT